MGEGEGRAVLEPETLDTSLTQLAVSYPEDPEVEWRRIELVASRLLRAIRGQEEDRGQHQEAPTQNGRRHEGAGSKDKIVTAGKDDLDSVADEFRKPISRVIDI